MSRHPLHPHSPWRIFAVSGLVTAVSIAGVLLGKGATAMLVALVLIAVEVAFSFDNAIVNAKVLTKMSSFWQTMFLTVGAAIAIFGMRLIFPIILVALTAGLGLHEVIDLALHKPLEYAHHLESAHIVLSSFGGAFLLMLALHFFINDSREVLWFAKLEHGMQQLASVWAPLAISTLVVIFASVVPANTQPRDTFVAGMLGIVVYGAIHLINHYIGLVQARSAQAVRVGVAGLVSFLYLEVLDASFSFDGVLGAFAITTDVVLIVIGLGVGAMWVRSLTVYMVRRGTLDSHIYIEHGAHYTIGVLALVLFISIFVNVPEVITGMIGLGIIGSSIVASRQALKVKNLQKRGV